MDFSKLNFGVDGDSITAGDQWSWHVFQNLGFASHHNVAVGSSVWYKRTITCDAGSVTTQDYSSPDFAGISDGWEETNDLAELQKRANNCAVVHTQRFISDVKSGNAPVPDVFAFAMGTNDTLDCLGDADKALTGKELDGNDNIDLFTEAGAMRDHNAKIEQQISSVMRKVAGGMSAQVIDCFHNSGICEKFEVIGGTGKYLRDGLHPDVPGQTLEGAYASKEIRNNLF